MPASPWRIDPGLARDGAALLGWDPAAGPEALVSAMGRRLAAGSVAKLAAMAADDVPPGWDPTAVLRSLLDDARVERGSPSWSCWVFCTVYAALVETTGVARARVAATRRIDERAPLVDFHSSVLLDDGAGATTLCDPYFYVTLGGPGTDEVEAMGDTVWALRTDEADGRWSYRVHHARWGTPLRYRSLGTDLDRGDVHAFCAVSVRFTGVVARPSACLLTDDGMVDARGNEDGTATVRHVIAEHPGQSWSATLHREVLPDWPAALARLHARTGIPLR